MALRKKTLEIKIWRFSQTVLLKYCPGLSNCWFFYHANLPGYPNNLNTTLYDKARLSRTTQGFEGHFKGVSSAIYENVVKKNTKNINKNFFLV